MKIMKAKNEAQWEQWMRKARLAETVREDLEEEIEDLKEDIEDRKNFDYSTMGEFYAKKIDRIKKIDARLNGMAEEKIKIYENVLEQMAELSGEEWLFGESLDKGEVVVITFTYQSGLTV